jgi:hypothetical protein
VGTTSKQLYLIYSFLFSFPLPSHRNRLVCVRHSRCEVPSRELQMRVSKKRQQMKDENVM